MKAKLPILIGALLLALPISLSAQVTAESESNNTDATADGPLTSGVSVTGNISSASDVDWYTFNVPSTGSINVTLNHATGRDFDIYLYKATGGSVASAATSARPAVINYSATTTGTYFLKVQRYSGTGAYDFRVTLPGGATPTPTPTPTSTATPTPTPTPTATPGGGLGSRPALPSGQTTYITGSNLNSTKTPVNGPGIMLVGGNFDVDEAFLNRAYPIANGGDVVVLRYSGTNGYNDYLYNLTTGALKPDSVESIVVDTVTKANSAYVEWVIKSAEFVYIAGGDQAQYLNAWKDTKVETALQYVYAQGGVIGGISAGCAVQGEYIYDPDGVAGIYSAEAVSNICFPSMIISNGFLDFPLTANIITDTHFAQRNRMGRLMAFVARINNTSFTPNEQNILGVGVDEDTCLFIDKNRIGYVDGDFSAYILRKTASTTYDRVSCGQTMKITNMSRTKVSAGQTFNFNTNATTGTTTNIGMDGSICTLTATQANACFYTPASVY